MIQDQDGRLRRGCEAERGCVHNEDSMNRWR